MENKQQTAVEWFLENLRNLIKESELTDMRPNEFDAREMELLEQAKEMEKQQKIEAYIAGSLTGCGCYDYMKKEDGEQYINKTYGGKK
jgi:hypothetical protein